MSDETNDDRKQTRRAPFQRLLMKQKLAACRLIDAQLEVMRAEKWTRDMLVAWLNSEGRLDFTISEMNAYTLAKECGYEFPRSKQLVGKENRDRIERLIRRVDNLENQSATTASHAALLGRVAALEGQRAAAATNHAQLVAELTALKAKYERLYAIVDTLVTDLGHKKLSDALKSLTRA